MTHHFHPKAYQKFIIFLILCSLWIGPKCIWVGKKAKTCLSKFDIKFLVLFTFNLVSFHASSRFIQVYLLHTEVSYIIDIACHWSFFPILPVLAIFWITKTPIFFQLSIFAEPVPSNLCYPMSTLITGLKHAISPYFGIVWVLFYNI